MTLSRHFLKSVLRFVCCALLLLAIFHSIFEKETRALLPQSQVDSSELTTLQRFKLIWKTGGSQLARIIRATNPWLLSISISTMGLAIYLGALRWNLVLHAQGLELPIRRTLEITLVAQFFNSFLLGASGGDLIKALFAARETKHLKTEAVTTVFLDRLIGLLSMLGFSVATMPLFIHQIQNAWPLLLSSLLTCGLLAIGVTSLYLARRGWVTRGWLGLFAKLEATKVGRHFTRSIISCARCTHRTSLLFHMILLSVAINALCVFQFWLIARALDISVTFSALALIVPMVVVFSAIPITPSGLGLRENLFVTFLAISPFEVPHGKALTLSLVAYATTVLWSAFGGLIYVAFKDSHKLAELTTPTPPTTN